MAHEDEGNLAPPWIAHPEWPCGDIAWRKGAGEDHYDRWLAEVWERLDEEDRERYLDDTRAPEEWREALLEEGEI